MKTYPLPIYVQRFFTERLATQLYASQNTMASYRDTFRILIKYASNLLGRAPTNLQIADIDADLIGSFLCFVETTRGNGTRSRNTRLSAIRSFFKYVAVHEPQLLYHCQRILAIPSKRYEKRIIDYLNRAEIEALLSAPDLATWFGRRDYTLLLLALQTGLRVSELISLTRGDVVLGTGAHVRCAGKGRKERSTPLRKDCITALRKWLEERNGDQSTPLFVSNRGERLSRDAIERIVGKYVKLAKQQPVENVQVVEGPFRIEQSAEVSVPAGKEHGRALLLKKGEPLIAEEIWMVGVLHGGWPLSLFDQGDLMCPRIFPNR